MSASLDYFNDTHAMLRDTVRRFVEREVLPHIDDWEEAGSFPGSCTRRPLTPASAVSVIRRSSAARAKMCL